MTKYIIAAVSNASIRGKKANQAIILPQEKSRHWKTGP